MDCTRKTMGRRSTSFPIKETSRRIRRTRSNSRSPLLCPLHPWSWLIVDVPSIRPYPRHHPRLPQFKRTPPLRNNHIPLHALRNQRQKLSPPSHRNRHKNPHLLRIRPQYPLVHLGLDRKPPTHHHPCCRGPLRRHHGHYIRPHSNLGSRKQGDE